jgi:hypothetical protein
MFYLSALAAINYDDQSQDLIDKKRQVFGEMRDQTIDALKKAKSVASELVGLLSKEIEFILDQYVLNMREILKSADKHDASALKNDLLIAMAVHLHKLREPAIKHFATLIEFSGNGELMQLLAKEQMESMVELLVSPGDDEQATGLPRTRTVVEDAGIYHIPDSARGCCFSMSLATKPNSLVQKHFAVSRDIVHRVEQQFQTINGQDHPGKVVLRPVNMVLMWFSDFSGKSEERKPDVTHGHGDEQDLECNSESDAKQTPHARKTMACCSASLCRSSQGRYMLLGTIFCMLYCIFYLITLRDVVSILGEGECAYEEVPCIMATIR